MELSNLKEFEVSSTTESQAPSTVPNKGESCNSFEYLNNDRNAGGAGGHGPVATAYTKSPFEREIQRLMKESRMAGGAAKDNANVIINGNKTSGSSSGGSSHGGAEINGGEQKPKLNNQSILMCGLDAIREIAKNKNPSESSQM